MSITGQMVNVGLVFAWLGAAAAVAILGTITAIAVIRTLRLCGQPPPRRPRRSFTLLWLLAKSKCLRSFRYLR